MKHSLHYWLVIVTGNLCTACYGAEAVDVQDLIQDKATTFVEKHSALGLVVGAQQGDRAYIAAAGLRGTADQAPPDETTVFEIGSITKAFTGVLLADAVERGEATLDQPLSELLGPDIALPEYEGKPIRLVHLATHTSGLPRLPTNLTMVNPFNPYAHYQVKDLQAFLAEYELPRAPGAQCEYSNFGMGLLGHALAKRAGMSYEELVIRRICKPLGMDDTSITLSDDQQSRLAQGVSSLGLPAMNWDLPTLAGAGALRSTLHDMMIFLRANMSPDDTPLAAAIRLSHKPRITAVEPLDEHGPKIEVGLAWHITTENEVSIIWHNGMTGGYAAFLALAPGEDIGIVVLSNSATFEVDRLGGELLKELLARKQTPN